MEKIKLCIGILFFWFSGIGQISNIGFELSAPAQYTAQNGVPGWTVDCASSSTNSCFQSSTAVWNQPVSEFWIRQTPFSHPIIGTIGNSPLGGARIAQLNNTSNSSQITRIRNTFQVTSANTQLVYAWCLSLNGSGNHSCCDQPFFRINLYNCFGQLQTFFSYSTTAPGGNCVMPNQNYTITSGTSWSNWRTGTIPLLPFLGSCVTLEMVVGDCTSGTHHGDLYFDAAPWNEVHPVFIPNLVLNGNGSPVSYCPGSNVATITAPSGAMSYSWTAPPGAPLIPPGQQTLSTLSIPNPLPYSTYTLTFISNLGYIYTSTYTIVPSQVTIAGMGSVGSCTNGANGSATVLANGSGSGYTYSWLNSNNMVVSTSSVASNLSTGIYTVNINAVNSPSCGSASQTIAVSPAGTQYYASVVPYCSGQSAYLSALSSTNVQWYNSNGTVPANLGGTAQSYTANNAQNGSVFSVLSTNALGCRDSLVLTLSAAGPGTLTAISPSLPAVCAGASTGNTSISINAPFPPSPMGNSFSVTAVSPTPPYSAGISASPLGTFVPTGLSAGVYTVNAFDGYCFYSSSFTLQALNINYTVSPQNQTVCPGNPLFASVNFASPGNSAQHTYSWSAPMWLVGSGNNQLATFQPSTTPGSLSTIVASVVVTSNYLSCSLQKTLAITAADPVPPLLQTFSPFCNNAPAVTLQGMPGGGTFLSAPGVNALNPITGLLTPSLAMPGLHTYTYTYYTGPCAASSAGTYSIKAIPSLTVAGINTVCAGAALSFSVSGADTYLWFNNTANPVLTFSPQASGTYSVFGTSTVSGCMGKRDFSLTVIPLPTLSITGQLLICEGESTTLTATGASNFSWNNGMFGNYITVNPPQTQTFVVTGALAPAFCENSASVTVTVDLCSGLAALSPGEFKIFPNPTEEMISFELMAPAKIEVYTSTGQKVFFSQFEKGLQSFDIRQLPPGVYFFVIQTGSKTFTEKVIKR